MTHLDEDSHSEYIANNKRLKVLQGYSIPELQQEIDRQHREAEIERMQAIDAINKEIAAAKKTLEKHGYTVKLISNQYMKQESHTYPDCANLGPHTSC